MTLVRVVQDGTDPQFRHPHHVILTSVSETACCTSCRKSARRGLSRECFYQIVGCLRNSTRARPGLRKIVLPSLAFVWAPCRSTKVFKLQEPFLLATLSSPMDTGCCAAADFKTFSLSVDMSLFPATLLVRSPCYTRGLVGALHGVVTLISVHRALFSVKSNPLLVGPLSHA